MQILLKAYQPYTLGGIPRRGPPSCEAPRQPTIYRDLTNVYTNENWIVIFLSRVTELPKYATLIR